MRDAAHLRGRDPEQVGRLANGWIVDAEAAYLAHAQAVYPAVEHGDVGPQRFERRPPPDARGASPVEAQGLGLRQVAPSGGHARWPQRVGGEDSRLVEVDDPGATDEIDGGKRERQPASHEYLRYQDATSETRQLLDDGRHGLLGQIQAAVGVRVVVAAVALIRAREPERASLGAGGDAPVPREAAMEDHANDSARSARSARSSSSARPARTRSMGRRSPRCGLSPKSHTRAASGA